MATRRGTVAFTSVDTKLKFALSPRTPSLQEAYHCRSFMKSYICTLQATGTTKNHRLYMKVEGHLLTLVGYKVHMLWLLRWLDKLYPAGTTQQPHGPPDSGGLYNLETPPGVDQFYLDMILKATLVKLQHFRSGRVVSVSMHVFLYEILPVCTFFEVPWRDGTYVLSKQVESGLTFDSEVFFCTVLTDPVDEDLVHQEVAVIPNYNLQLKLTFRVDPTGAGICTSLDAQMIETQHLVPLVAGMRTRTTIKSPVGEECVYSYENDTSDNFENTMIAFLKTTKFRGGYQQFLRSGSRVGRLNTLRLYGMTLVC